MVMGSMDHHWGREGHGNIPFWCRTEISLGSSSVTNLRVESSY